jgi:hypothetical protein
VQPDHRPTPAKIIGELGGPRSVLAAAVWVTVAWLGAVAVRQRRSALVADIGAAAVLLGLLRRRSYEIAATWPCRAGHGDAASRARRPRPA